MFTHFKLSAHAFLGLLLGLLLGATPLRAQLDPRLQTNGPSFMDMYQQSQNLVMKPEIVTVFDFSGSMAAVMFHPDYQYPVNTDTSDSGGGAGMKFTLTSPVVGRYDVTVSLTAGLTLTGGKLVRPDGSLLDYASGGDTAINTNYVKSNPLLGGESNVVGFKFASDVRNWIRCASHVRFKDSMAGGRTFDLPICWTILDDPSVQPDVAAGKFRKMYNDYPLKLKIINPATGTEIEMDTSYRVASQVANDPFGMYTSTTGSAPMTACTLGEQYYFIYWKSAYITWIFRASTSIIPSTWPEGKAFAQSLNPDPVTASKMIPARTRVQGAKDAALRTWTKYYNKVFWAYRFLKYTAPDSDTSQYDNATYLYNDSRTNMNLDDPTLEPRFGCSDRGWVLLNNNSDTGLKRLAVLLPGGSTTLNSALANTYAQLNDPNCVFNDIETGDDKPVECRNTYVMLFTDGVPNTDPGTPTNTNTKYVGAEPPKVPAWPATYGTAKTGNAYFAAVKTRIDPSNAAVQYNIINLAGLAAHGGDTANGGWVAPAYPIATQPFPTPVPTKKVSDWIPFWIKERGAGTDKVVFTKPRAITTMTIGLSLVGNITNAAHPKRRLFLAAVVGEPSRLTWDAASLTPFTLADPNDPTKGKTPNSVFFFDAVDPGTLVNSLDAAFNSAALSSNINSTANPNLPFIGGSFGKQVYLGKFRPPSAGNVIWPGDLYMFATKEVAGQTQFLNKTGTQAAVLDGTTAQWAASNTFLDPASPNPPRWTTRKLYTRIPGTLAVPEPGLTLFSDVGYNAVLASEVAPYKTIQPFVATTQVLDSARRAAVQLSMGGDITKALDASGRPTLSRVDALGNTLVMGDIINSSPTAIQYNWADVLPKLSTTLANAGTRFRLILVGTNQGWLHAFGEVSMIDGDTDPVTNAVYNGPTKGAVEELWAFMPTDFLSRLDYLTSSANPHRFMVDGTPAIYHLDLPPTTGGSPNGVVDSTERALAIIGLRKGGRSYYALDIHDPYTPSLKWSMVPDEAAFFPTIAAGTVGTRLVTKGPSAAIVKGILGNMGYSTCTPGIGRIQFDGNYRDAVFLGGGFSIPEVEANFANVKLGRSVMALDVWTGQVLAAADLTSATIGGTTVGPVVSGLVPFEFIVNSGMAQRAYFTDFYGGLWAWGSKKIVGDGGAYDEFRMDTSDLSLWTNDMLSTGAAGIRKVAQDGTAPSALYWTLPAPFRIGSFPGQAHKSGSPPPAAVGIAMVSGDRNNPLSNGVGTGYVSNKPPAPASHRMTVVFDRQDSRGWGLDTAVGPDTGILDTNLKNFSANSVSANPSATPCSDAVWKDITPNCSSFYLAPFTAGPPNVYTTPAQGYYMNFPAGSTAPYIKKGLSEPMVVAGSLFYSYFDPTSSDPCTGGSGITSTVKVCDVIYPLAKDTRTDVSCASNIQSSTFVGIASSFTAYGTRGVLQAGSTGVANPPAGASTTTPVINTYVSRQQERHPKVRVWRTVR